MKTTAMVLFEAAIRWSSIRLGPGEVLVKYTPLLCHSDLHLTDGDLPPRFDRGRPKGPGSSRRRGAW